MKAITHAQSLLQRRVPKTEVPGETKMALSSWIHRAAVALLAFTFMAAPAAFAQTETITLGVSQQKVVKVPGGVQRVAIGDPEVADVRTIGTNEVLVTGVAEGRTTLLIW